MLSNFPYHRECFLSGTPILAKHTAKAPSHALRDNNVTCRGGSGGSKELGTGGAGKGG